MLRKTLISGVLSLVLGVTSMPALAAPFAPAATAFNNPTVTQVGYRGHRVYRSHRVYRGHRGYHRHRVYRSHRVYRGGGYYGGYRPYYGAVVVVPYYGGYYGGCGDFYDGCY